MEEVTIIGMDLAKNAFRVHVASAAGLVMLRKKLLRPQFAGLDASRDRTEGPFESTFMSNKT